MADSTTEIDLDSVIDRLLEGELAHYSLFGRFVGGRGRWCGLPCTQCMGGRWRN